MKHLNHLTTLSFYVKFIQIAIFSVLLCCSITPAKAQQADSSQKDFFKQQIMRNAQPRPPAWQSRVNTLSGPTATVADTGNAAPAKIVYRSRQVKQNEQGTKSIQISSKRTLNDFCKDTSYTRLLSVYRGQIYVESVDEINSGGMVIAASMIDTAHLPVASWRMFMLLLKVDDDGNIVWLKQFEDLTPGDFSTFFMDKVFELPNQEIICTGFWNNDGNSSVYNSVIYRLTSAGDIIWVKSFKSLLSGFNSPLGSFNFAITGVARGNNGDIIICGVSYANASGANRPTVIRLDSTGNLVWDAHYGEDWSGTSTNIFFDNGAIVLSAVIHIGNTDIPPAVSFFTIDYEDGKILSKRHYAPDYADDWERFTKGFTSWNNKCIRLANGHYLAYGKLFSDFGGQRFPGHYFGVVEFDAGFNFVDAYTIYSDIKSNFYNSQLDFAETGKGFLYILKFTDLKIADAFFGSFYNHQFLHQRKVEYRQDNFSEYNGAALLRSGAYVSIQGMFKDGYHTSYFEWRKMHDSDTASECLGRDTMLFRFSPLIMKEYPDYITGKANITGKVEVVVPNITQRDTLRSDNIDGCKQTNFCDTVKIQGSPLICGINRAASFNAFKNRECGSIVQWQIDPGVVDSLQILSDTSVVIWFKNITWNGKLYALSSAGKCFGTVIDSMEVHLVKSEGEIDLGKDTALCPGNTIVLNAGSGYRNYEWQDHSTDSVFTVNKPGTYRVTAEDFCGADYADTVVVLAAPQVAFNMGADIEMCSNRPVTITAPPDFLNYNWSPNQSISSTTGPSVTISPLVNTTYYITAEKTPGCFAYDTLLVTVYSTPNINLGSDTSFCEGGMMTLNAGGSFSQVQWSNGSTMPQVDVTKAGTYSVTGITLEGCKSFDTLRVVAVWPKPIVDLGTDRTLCAGNARVLNAGNHTSYLWQDGSTAPTYMATGKGSYHVQVTDGHQCAGSDTLDINTILPPPSDFLKASDSLCVYEKLWLSPATSYESYYWNTGATSASIQVTSPGIYALRVSDSKGCIGTDTTVVAMKECLEGFYIPNAFTPNNDKLNDLFKPVIGAVLKEYTFTIYNRWGQVVFFTKDIQDGWDGTYKGVIQNPGIFMWVCTWQAEGGTRKTEKGTVTLIR